MFHDYRGLIIVTTMEISKNAMKVSTDLSVFTERDLMIS